MGMHGVGHDLVAEQQQQDNFTALKILCAPPIHSTFSTAAAAAAKLRQLCPTLCNPMDCSMPGLPVLHHLPKFAQVQCIGDAIQPSHPLMPPFPSALNLSQHQGLFQ